MLILTFFLVATFLVSVLDIIFLLIWPMLSLLPQFVKDASGFSYFTFELTWFWLKNALLCIMIFVSSIVISPIIYVLVRELQDGRILPAFLYFCVFVMGDFFDPKDPSAVVAGFINASREAVPEGDFFDGFFEAYASASQSRMFSVVSIFVATFFTVGFRFSRMARYSARAPRMGIRSVALKYFERRSGRGKIIFVGILHAFCSLFYRSIIVVLMTVFLFLTWRLIFHFSWGYDYWGGAYIELFSSEIPGRVQGREFVYNAVPVMTIFLLSSLFLIIQVISVRGLRILNSLLLLYISIRASMAGYSLNHGIWLDIRGEGLTNLISVALAFCILIRGWVLVPIRGVIANLRRDLIRTASSIIALSSKPPIVLLRSFSDDRTVVPASYRSFVFAFGGQPIYRTLDEIVANTLFSRGPVIALADPKGGVLAPLGAARDLVSDDGWRDHILQHVVHSQLIVCILGTTPNFLWEVEQIIALGLTKKVLFVLGPDYPRNRTVWETCPELAIEIGIADLATERKFGRKTRAFAYDRTRASWCSISTPWVSERAYVEAIRVGSEMMRAGSPSP